MLKTGDYDIWSIRMEQYITHTDYALWEVFVNGDAPAIASGSTEGPIPPKTAEQKIARKNELKAKSTLLLAISDEHLLKFHGIKDAKSLWETIKTRNLSEIGNSMVKYLLGRMQSYGIKKLSLAWNNIALIIRNKPDLDTMSMDDLYNNLKVYEAEIKSQSSSSSSPNSQNMAFVSSENTSSTNEAVNTAHDFSTANSQGQASSSSYADDVMFSFFVSQSKSPLLDNKDMKQIDSDDLKEIDLKWKVAMLTIRIKRFIKKTRRNLNLNGKEAVGLDMIKIETSDNALVVHRWDRCYDWSFQLKKGPTQTFALMAPFVFRIVVHEKNEASYEESIAFLKYDVQVKDISIKNLKNQLKEALKKKDDLKLKLENFEESSKNLTKLINSQISVKDKAGLSFDSHVNESEVLDNVVDSHECNQVNDRFKKSKGCHAVPPFTGNFKPARANLSFAGLDDSVYKSKVSETITSVPNVETIVTKTSKDSLKKPKTVRLSALIIEDWESNSEDENVFEPKEVKKTVKTSFEKIEFVNARNSTVENPRKFSQNPRDNKRNRNGFGFTKKAFFVCGSFNHLIKDYDFHDKKMVQKPVMNNVKKGTGQREVRQVWNNAMRVNHQNFSKWDFTLTTVLTNSGIVNSVNTAKGNRVTSDVGEQGINVVKSSACWIWRPKGNVLTISPM
ncbi:hypothetical protein Tco_0559852 [Tanacetum coccineum]